jgi:hypothetical protein
VSPIGTMTMASLAASALISETFSLDHSISARVVASERRQRGERHAQVLLVQAVDLAVHRVEEDEAVEPAHQIVLSHAHANMGRAAADGELTSNSLVGLRFFKSGISNELVANSSVWPER